MADGTEPYVLPLHVHTHMWATGGPALRALGAPNGGNTNWPTANRVIYTPFSIPWPYPVSRAFWVNGATIASSIWDYGVYTWEGAKILSTLAQDATPASDAQYTTLTRTLIPAGRYYHALVNNGTTTRGLMSNAATTEARLLGLLQEDIGAAPAAGNAWLPATMTPAQFTVTGLPVCGFTLTDTGF